MEKEELTTVVETIWGITQEMASDTSLEDVPSNLEKMEKYLKDVAKKHELYIEFGELYNY